LQTQTVFSGGTVLFTVESANEAPLTYEWRRNGKKINAQDRTLVLTKVELASAGTYSVVVSNDGGSVASAATLMVLAPSIASLSPGTEASGGGAFILTVNGSAFVSGSAVEWNGALRPTVFVSSSMLIAAIAANDIPKKGVKTVEATVQSPSGDRSNVRVIVVSP
jgi:PKD repeat protein